MTRELIVLYLIVGTMMGFVVTEQTEDSELTLPSLLFLFFLCVIFWFPILLYTFVYTGLFGETPGDNGN